MDEKRAALIGCGYYAQKHIKAWLKLDGVAVVAVCDRDKQRASDFADLYSISDVYAQQPYLGKAEKFIILDLGIHLLDLARYFMGEAQSVYARTMQVNRSIRGEDSAVIVLGMANGATCIVDVSYGSHQAVDHFPQILARIEGTHGSVELLPNYDLELALASSSTKRNVAPDQLSWSSIVGNVAQHSVLAVERHWLECIARGATPETSGDDNLKTLRLVFGAYSSASSGEAVRLEPKT